MPVKKAAKKRRRGGFELPLTYVQLLGWLIYFGTFGICCAVILPGLPVEAQTYACSAVTVLYAVHLVLHFTVTELDPAEKELRERADRKVCTLDRTKHSHAIENGFCHLCNIQISDGKTKHCIACNKCVYKFDHHCVWLNQCIGERNYKYFIATVLTVSTIAFMHGSLVLLQAPITELINYPGLFTDCNSTDANMYNSTYTGDGIYKLEFQVVFCITYALLCCFITIIFLQLLTFHIIITRSGISTYEYITINLRELDSPSFCSRFHQRANMFLCLGIIRRRTPKPMATESGEVNNLQNPQGPDNHKRSFLGRLIPSPLRIMMTKISRNKNRVDVY